MQLNHFDLWENKKKKFLDHSDWKVYTKSLKNIQLDQVKFRHMCVKLLANN